MLMGQAVALPWNSWVFQHSSEPTAEQQTSNMQLLQTMSFAISLSASENHKKYLGFETPAVIIHVSMMVLHKR